MRKANIFKRILSCMLVLTLIMSGLGLDLGGITKDNNVIEVEAVGDGSGYSVGGISGSGTSAKIHYSAGSNWSGIRFTLVPMNLLTGGRYYKGKFTDGDSKASTCYTAQKIYELLSTNEKYSILVTDFTDDVYCMPNRGAGFTSSGEEKLFCRQATASSLNQIFGRVSVNGTMKDFPERGENYNSYTVGDFYTSLWDVPESGSDSKFNPNKNDNYFGAQGVFNRVLEEGSNSSTMMEHFKNYLKNKWSRTLSDTVNAESYVIVAEPVVISYVNDGSGLRKNNDVQGKYFALSLQDCLYRNQKGDKWSYAFTQAAYPCKNEGPDIYIKKGGNWRTLLYNMKHYYFKFIDREGVFLGKDNVKFKSGVGLSNNVNYWDTGFAVFSTAKGTSGAKTGVSYTLFTDNSADSVSQNIKEVWGKSLGTISQPNYKTIKVTLDEDDDNGVNSLDDSLASGVSNLKETTNSSASNGTFTYNKNGNVAGDNLSVNLTGKKKSEWKSKLGETANKYTNQGFGVVKIPYASGVNKKLVDFHKAIIGTNVLASIKDISLKTDYNSVDQGSCNKSFGKQYYVKVDGDVSDSYNIVKKVAGTVKSSSSIFYGVNASDIRNTKVTFSRLGSMNSYSKFNNYAINGALYALKCSKDLESLTVNNDGSSGKIVSRETEVNTYKDFVDADGDGNIDLDENGNEIYKTVTEAGDESELSTLGVSVMLMVPKKNITSYIACATLDRDTGTVSNKSKDDTTYDVTESGVLTIPSSYKAKCYYVVVPNTSLYNLGIEPNGNTIFNSFVGNEELSSLDEFKTQVRKATGLTDNDFVGAGDDLLGGATFKVGSTDRNVGEVKGYSVILLEVKGSVTKKSDLKLMDYELNYIYPSMLTDGKYGSLTNDISYKTLADKYVGCPSHHSVDYSYSRDKFVQASSSYAGNIIDKNKTLGINKNILQYDTYTGGYFTTELNARNGYTFTDNLTNVRFSLAVNLIRSSFGDKRVISSITKQTSDVAGGIDEDYAKNNLELTFANKPNTQVSASALRDSKAQVGSVLKDTFEWNVSFTHTDCSPYRSDLISGQTSCRGHGSNPTTYCSPTTWYEIVKTQVPASDYGEKIRYKVNETAFKYQTTTLDTGKNNTKTVADSLQKPTNGKGSNSSLVSPYKIAVVHSSNSELSFYPEVRMRAYSSTGDMVVNASTNSGDENNRLAGGYVTPHNLLTMGEVIRKVKPSAMYVIRVNHKYDSGSEVNPAIKGSTISDSTAVGTNADAVSDGKPVIYAGGDVTVKVNPDFRLNMYGYSLDLIETSDNNLADGGNYASVINDNSNIKSVWGNTYTSTDIKKEFDDWAKDILTKHLGVDMTLTVNGSGVNKEFNNFTSSLGNLDTSASVADGVYNIKVKEGTIVKDWGGYQNLINQIKNDYELNSETDAEKIFTNSDIWQSIERAVEDSNDSFNNSQTSDAIAPNRAHWYDEEVKTFVIRRYKKENLEIKNVVVNDKIDYGAAPTADDTTASLDSYKKADAKWYMTLYLKKDGAKKTPDGFSDSTVYYNPSHHDGLSGANDTGSVLINEVYVDGADFVIPSASTYDMGN